MDAFDLRLWPGFATAGGNTAASAFVDQITIDSRRIDSKNALFVALEGQSDDGHRFIAQAVKSGARYILAKKGWHPPTPIPGVTLLHVDSPLRAFQQIAGTYRKQMPCKVIAIAGSHGKTMVKDLLLQMLQTSRIAVASPESFNSQIGVPLSLLTIRKHHEVALIEAGISKKEEMQHLSDIVSADYAIVTHIGRKHIATLGDLPTVASEMLKILRQPPKNEWAILPRDPHILKCIEDSSINCHFWSEHSPGLPHATFTSEEREVKMSYQVDFPDGTQHQGYITSGFYYFLDLINITAKAAWLIGIPSAAISQTLREYTPEPMRTEIWKSPFGASFVNETYCSDPQSVDKALKHFQQAPENSRKVFVFGGMRSQHEHSDMDYKRIGTAIHNAGIDRLILFGRHNFQPLISEVKNLNLTQCDTYNDSLSLLKDEIKNDDFVLIKGDNKHPIDLLIETFNDSICSNQCVINLAAIAENIQTIRHKIPPKTRIMVIVKALAYGTDEIRMAKFLETCGIDILGVSYVDEGVVLRRCGVTQSIFVINAAVYEAAKVVKWNLEVGVSDAALIDAIAAEAAKQKRTIKVHLHIDTGMGRFGCRPEEALHLCNLILKSPFLQLEGIMTHFACADDPSQDNFTVAQAQCLQQVIESLQTQGISLPWRHAANSGGALRFNFPEFNMVRIGLAVYGLHSSHSTREAIQLRLALSLVSHIVGINVCKKGETISYGRSYSVERNEQKIAVLPLGYFDGLHRNYSGKGVVIIRGQKAAMVGKICMDFMMIDVTDIPGAIPGDPVLIFGEDEHGCYLSPEDLASSGDSIVHELITCLGPRIQRIFVYEEAHRTH